MYMTNSLVVPTESMYNDNIGKEGHPSLGGQFSLYKTVDLKIPISLINGISEISFKGLFIRRLMLCFTPILAGKRYWMHGFHRPSKMRFLRLRLHRAAAVVFADALCLLPSSLWKKLLCPRALLVSRGL